MRIILADAPASTLLIVDCNSDESYRTTPQCPDTFLMLFVNLSHLLGLYLVSLLAGPREWFGLAI